MKLYKMDLTYKVNVYYSNYIGERVNNLTTEYDVSSENTFGISVNFKLVSGVSYSGISSNGRVDVLGIGDGLKLDLTVV